MRAWLLVCRWLPLVGLLIGVLAHPRPASAQMTGVIRGMVVDARGEPVASATVEFKFEGGVSRHYETKTDAAGSFVQIGLPPGPYTVTGRKEGVGAGVVQVRVKLGERVAVKLDLTAAGVLATLSEAERAKIESTNTAFKEAVAAHGAGNYDEAIAKFTEVLAAQPDCVECQYNIGVAYAQKREYDRAEAAFKKTLGMKAEHAGAYEGLAQIYNAQRKFDLAAEATAQAAKLRGGAPGGAGNASAVFDQGLILWNAGKTAEAKKLFEETLKLDPKHAEVHYWLGMASLNEGKLPDARTELDLYLKADPTGRFAEQAKAMLSQIKP